MKTLTCPNILVALLCTVIFLTACEHNINTGSTVYEDGSLDRTVMVFDADSAEASNNIMGVNKARGWETIIDRVAPGPEENEAKYNVTLRKHFSSVDEANLEMGGNTDTLFHIRSSLKNRNRWFFTYMEYSDTYVALDRFKTIPQGDYFTKEDYAFIERLPAEGRRITKSDSLYLARLNEKIFEIYGARTIFEEQFKEMLAVLGKYNVPVNWKDSLLRKKETIYQRIFEEVNVDDETPSSNSDILSVASDMGIPLPFEAEGDIREKLREIESRLNFISKAYSAKYIHSIKLPWTVVSSNADSINSNTLYWNPPVIKFLLKDYTMTACARKMNVWQVSISAILMLATLSLFAFRRRIS